MKFTPLHIDLLISMQTKNIKFGLLSAGKSRCLTDLYDAGYVTNTNDDWYSITTRGFSLLRHLIEAAEDHSQATG